MKRFLLLIITTALAVGAYGRDIINLNRNWTFNSGVFLDNKISEKVILPHVWAGAEEVGNISGTGAYFREFNVPDDWINKRVYIKFKGVATVANLFINGRFAGEHEGAFTAFTFEITPFLNFGQINSIMVNVNNTPQFDVMPYAGDMNIYGGIYRDVELIITDRNHISLSDYSSSGVYLTQTSVSPTSANVSAKVLLDGRSGSNIDVDVTVYQDTIAIASASKRVDIKSNGKGEVTLPLTISKPRLWNGEKDPFLYQVKVTTTDNLGLTDEVIEPLGIRTVSVDRELGFMLNGEPYKLKGVNKYQDRSELGSSLREVHHAEDIKIIREMGANAIRMIYGPQDPYMFDLCDRAGIVVWSELPFIGGAKFMGKGFVDSYAFRANGERQLMEMIKQNYNHPSIAFWGIFNEITQKGDNPLMYIQQLNALAHREAPGQLTASASNEDGDINFITDVVGWGQYHGWESGNAENMKLWIDAFKNGWKNLMPGISGYGAGANVLHQQEELIAAYADDQWHPENWQTHIHQEYLKMLDDAPFLWGAFVNTMFDYGSHRSYGGGLHGINDMGLVSFDRHTKKDAFYLYKARWNDSDPFVHITKRRDTKRSSELQEFTIFTNLPSVELVVNGQSMGTVDSVDGVATWADVPLKRGKNTILSYSGKYRDYIEVELMDQLAQ